MRLIFIFLLLITLPVNVLSQIKNDLGDSKSISIKKKKERKIKKLKNPKWLKVREGNIGSFTDNKNSYKRSVSLESNFENTGRMSNNGREDLVYGNSGYDYHVLEKKIIQVALFRPDIRELDISITANCGGTFESKDYFQYQDIQNLYLQERDLELIRKYNAPEKFIKGNKVTVPSVYNKIILATNYLCK